MGELACLKQGPGVTAQHVRWMAWQAGQGGSLCSKMKNSIEELEAALNAANAPSVVSAKTVKGKTYYVKVRSYSLVNGKKVDISEKILEPLIQCLLLHYSKQT